MANPTQQAVAQAVYDLTSKWKPDGAPTVQSWWPPTSEKPEVDVIHALRVQAERIEAEGQVYYPYPVYYGGHDNSRWEWDDLTWTKPFLIDPATGQLSHAYAVSVLNQGLETLKKELFEPVPPIGAMLPYRAGFCSHYDPFGRLCYDAQYWPYLWALHVDGKQDDGRDPLDTMRATLKAKQQAGFNTVLCDLPNGSVYQSPDVPNAPGNWTKTQPDWTGAGYDHFLDMVAFIQGEGFYTDVYYCDTPTEVTNGSLSRWLKGMQDRGLAARSWHTHAWESFGKDRTWFAADNWAAMNLIRSTLGPDAKIAAHMDSAPPGRCTPATYVGEGLEEDTPADCNWKDYHDPLKPGIGSYVEKGDPVQGDEIEGARQWPVDMIKMQMPTSGTSHGTQESAWRERHLECWERYAKPDTFMPSEGRTVRSEGAPDWFAGDDKRVEFCEFEPAVPFSYFRGWINDAIVKDVKAWADGLNIKNQGSLPL